MKLKSIIKGMPVCLFLISASALSGDQAWFRFRGFSADGSYAAWEMGGFQDGSGFQWIEAEILNTETSLPEDGLRHVWNEYMDEAPDSIDIASFDENILNMCRKYGIESGNSGNLLVYHPVTDLGVSGDTVAFCLESYMPDYNSGEIVLILSTLPAQIEQDYPDWFPSPVTPMIHIVVNGEKYIFFGEEWVPEPYGMNFDYSVAAVYSNPVSQKQLLVVLHSLRPGFEGSDGRFRVVSGSFDQQ